MSIGQCSRRWPIPPGGWFYKEWLSVDVTATSWRPDFGQQTGGLQHLDALGAAGLIHRSKVGREVQYRVTPEPLTGRCWMLEVGSEWDERVTRLRSLLGPTTVLASPEGRYRPSVTPTTGVSRAT